MIMKNNINRLTLLLLVLLGGVGFTSCSDDDNDFIELGFLHEELIQHIFL